MKTIFLIGDGMGDYPCPELDNKTPLQAAVAPNMRKIAAVSEVQMLQTVPNKLPAGSDVCNLGLLGYNAEENYTGRAPIEAAGQQLPLKPSDAAIRCNLVNVQDGIMIDYSAGHITTEEGIELISAVAEKLNTDERIFHPGISYRHLLIWNNGPHTLETTPPHDIPNQAVSENLPKGEGDATLIELMEASKEILANHPVNLKRIEEGKLPATQIWLWGQGKALQLKTFKELYGINGTMITAVDLLRGLGHLAGLDVPDIPGVTGFVDTNYAGKVEYALNAIEKQDFIYVHIEAPDECGHLGDAKLKTQAISDFDEKVVGPILDYMEAKGEAYQLLLTMDHRTPVSTKAHSRDPVPVAVMQGPVGEFKGEAPFDESIGDEAKLESWQLVQGLFK